MGTWLPETCREQEEKYKKNWASNWFIYEHYTTDTLLFLRYLTTSNSIREYGFLQRSTDVTNAMLKIQWVKCTKFLIYNPITVIQKSGFFHSNISTGTYIKQFKQQQQHTYMFYFKNFKLELNILVSPLHILRRFQFYNHCQ